MEFLHIVQSAFRGIVGNVISLATDGIDIADQIRTASYRVSPTAIVPSMSNRKSFLFFRRASLAASLYLCFGSKVFIMVLISELETLRFMLAMNVVTVKEKTAREAKNARRENERRET